MCPGFTPVTCFWGCLVVPQAARADALHLLATKLATPSLEGVSQPAAAAGGAEAVASGTPHNRELFRAAPSPTSSRPPPRAALGCDPLPTIDLSALSDLREFLTARLFRFLVHRDEVLDADSSAAGVSDDGNPRSVDRHGGGGPDGASRGKGKQRARRRRGGRFQLVPLRLLEERAAPGVGHRFGENNGGGKGHSHGVARNVRGRGVVARDPIGHLLKCCWALVPAIEGSTEAAPGDDAHGRVMPGPGKREETEAVARAVLGAGRRRSGKGGKLGKGGGLEVRTREGEALAAVVDFLQRGGGMEVSFFRSKARVDAQCTRWCSPCMLSEVPLARVNNPAFLAFPTLCRLADVMLRRNAFISFDSTYPMEHRAWSKPTPSNITHVPRSSLLQTLRVVTPPNQGAESSQEANGDIAEPPPLPPPTCHPGVVSPLTALGVVVTLSEALVDCLLSGESRATAILIMFCRSVACPLQKRRVSVDVSVLILSFFLYFFLLLFLSPAPLAHILHYD